MGWAWLAGSRAKQLSAIKLPIIAGHSRRFARFVVCDFGSPPKNVIVFISCCVLAEAFPAFTPYSAKRWETLQNHLAGRLFDLKLTARQIQWREIAFRRIFSPSDGERDG